MVSDSIGTSTVSSIEFVVRELRSIQPKTILDVGCGWGRWGTLAREFLELWEHRYQRHEWQVHITGIDIFPPTWTPLHQFVYDSTITGDIREMSWVGEYDVIIATDVLEHMTLEESRTMIKRFLTWSHEVLIGMPLSVPGMEWPLRGGVHNNPHEEHVYIWHEDDLEWIEHLAGVSNSCEIRFTEDWLSYVLLHLTW